jgi:hypothetical protein
MSKFDPYGGDSSLPCRIQTVCGVQTRLRPNTILFLGQGVTPTIHFHILMKAEKEGGVCQVPKRK